MQSKVTKTRMHEIHFTSKGGMSTSEDVIIAEGKLILLKENRIANNGDLIYVYPQYDQTLNGGHWIYKSPPCPLPYWGGVPNTYKVIKPIIISETENTERGELCYSPTQNQIGINGDSWEATNQKILVFPEQFSPKHIQAIVDGKMKDGNKVLVECDERIIKGDLDSIPKRWFETKLNRDGYVTLHKNIVKETYTREEVIALINLVWATASVYGVHEDNAKDCQSWIDTNLR